MLLSQNDSEAPFSAKLSMEKFTTERNSGKPVFDAEINSFEGQAVPRFITNTTRGLERHFHPTLVKFENIHGMI